jgi:hypothetical protein
MEGSDLILPNGEVVWRKNISVKVESQRLKSFSRHKLTYSKSNILFEQSLAPVGKERKEVRLLPSTVINIKLIRHTSNILILNEK